MSNTCVCCGREIPEGSQVCVICGQKPKQKERQIDRIRNMSVDEIAKFIDTHDIGVGEKICYWYCEKTTGNKYKCPYNEKERDTKCIECVKQWLLSEV